MSLAGFGLGFVDARYLQRVRAVTFASGENVSLGAANDGTHGYFVASPNRQLVKVRLSDMVRVAVGSLSHLGGAVVVDGSHAYVSAIDGGTRRLSKIRLSDMVRVAESPNFSGASGPQHCLVRVGSELFVGASRSPDSSVLRLDTATMNLTQSIFALGSGEFDPRSAVTDNTHVYFGMNTSPGRVVKVRVSDLVRISAVTLNSGENQLRCAVTDGTHGYFGTNTSPGRIVKVRLSDMARISALTLNAGENELLSATTDGAFGYFGTGNAPAKVVKVRLSDMTRIDAVTLASGENVATAATLTGQHAYFGTSTSPARAVKVDIGML